MVQEVLSLASKGQQGKDRHLQKNSSCAEAEGSQ
jgi:hypothetical protein